MKEIVDSNCFILTESEKDDLILEKENFPKESDRIDKIISDSRLSEVEMYPELIEKSIYNYTIREARIKCIERTWTNNIFCFLTV